jgi:hypothetical protein
LVVELKRYLSHRIRTGNNGVLVAAILKRLGYDVKILILPKCNHAMAAIYNPAYL